MTAKLSITSAAPETETFCAIPVYNNAATIADVARRARAELQNVLVIDDGSTDADLRELLKDLDVTVIRHPVNRGKGAALATAFTAAAERGARYLITLDGDGQHFPEDIPRFFPQLADGMILIGRRDEIAGAMPGSSLFGREFSDFWIGVETGVIVHDTQSGFRAYPVQHVRQLQIESLHYNFEMEIVARALWAGLRVETVPIRVFYPDAEDRVSSFHPFRDNARIAKVHAKLVLRELLPIPHRAIEPQKFSPSVAAATEGGGEGDILFRGQKALTPTLSQSTGRGGRKDASRWPASDEVPAGIFNQVSWMAGLRSPLGLAASVLVATMFGIILWPWGPVATIYVTGRLHLNKAAALFVIALTTLPIIPTICLAVADKLLGPPAAGHPHWRWFVGSHIVAFAVAPVLTLLVYFVAKFRAKPA
jgi:hypothetical protein